MKMSNTMEYESRTYVSNWYKNMRLGRKWSMQKVADKAGVSVVDVAKIEQAKEVKLSSFVAITKALDGELQMVFKTSTASS